MKTSHARRIFAPVIAAVALGMTGCQSDHREAKETAVTTVYTQVPPAPSAPAPVTVVPAAPPTAVTPPPAPAPAVTADTVAPVAPTDGGVAVSAVPAQRPALPTVVNEILDLSQGGVGDNVLLEFVNKAQVAYELSAENILYLKDVGLSDEVIAAIVKRGHDLREQGAPQARVVATAAPADLPAESATVAPSPAPETVAQVPPPVQSVTVTQPVGEAYDYWYSTLAPYGNWMYLSDYGWCWQPTAVRTVVGWRPYGHHGRWLWTSSGWYWSSYYSWGWAPFHYGRWSLSPSCGWVWVPGSVWAPAWVTWRYCDDYWGWAPLPPAACWTSGVGLTWYGSSVSIGFGFNLGWDCYTYVAPAHFCHPHPYRYYASRQEVVKVHNTTIVNNITYNNNTTIVNSGVSPQRYRELTRQEVPRATLADASTPARASSLEAASRPGANTRLAVYRPPIPDQPGFARARVDAVPARPSRASQEVGRVNPLPAPGAAVPMGRAPSRSSAGATTAPQPSRVTPSRDVTAVPSSRVAPSAAPPTRSAPSVTPPTRSATPPSRVSPAPVTSVPAAPQSSVPRRTDGVPSAPIRGSDRSTAPRTTVPSRVNPPAAPSRSGGNSPAPTTAPSSRSSLYQSPVTSPSRGEVQRIAPSYRQGTPPPKFSNPEFPRIAPSQRSANPGVTRIQPSVPPSVAPSRPSYSAPAAAPPSSGRSFGPPSSPSPSGRGSGGSPASPPAASPQRSSSANQPK